MAPDTAGDDRAVPGRGVRPRAGARCLGAPRRRPDGRVRLRQTDRVRAGGDRRPPAARGRAAGFLLGAATSAHQIEGGTHNDWTDWETGRYPDGTPARRSTAPRAARAADSWNLLARRSGRAAADRRQRLPPGDRVEPPRARARRLGRRRRRALPRDVRRAARGGDPPMVTLYHFTLPPWVAARGGWEWDGAPAALAAFAGARGRGVRRPRSTGGARSTSRTSASPRATSRGSGRRACSDPAARRRRCWRR